MNSNTKKFWSNRNAKSTVVYVALPYFYEWFHCISPTFSHTAFLFLQTGEELIDGNHYASHEIEARIETLNTHWQNLSEK